LGAKGIVFEWVFMDPRAKENGVTRKELVEVLRRGVVYVEKLLSQTEAIRGAKHVIFVSFVWGTVSFFDVQMRRSNLLLCLPMLHLHALRF
jgi:hypothetical protein